MSEGGLKEQLAEIKELVEVTSKKKKKVKKFKLPFKARLNKAKLNRAYVTVQVINENKSIEFRREPIVDGTVKLGDTFHAVADFDIFFFKGKPLIMQPKDRVNPWNPVGDQKETYGQKFVMARMKSDAIKGSGKKIGGIAIIGLLIAAVVGYYIFTGGSFS